jgi:predicted amidohydrolase YtcJ
VSVPITIFTARKIITMSPSLPEATAVAVRDGRILGVGTVDELKGWGEHRLDETFRDKVLLPGFVEAHCHAMEGAMWSFPYVGYFDRTAPDGKRWAGCRSVEAVIDRLREAAGAIDDPKGTLFAWGLDPIYFPGERMTATQLDRVSATRPIFVFHANAHLATVNSALMRSEGITADIDALGVVKGADGEPIGELQELQAMIRARTALGMLMRASDSAAGIRNMGRACVNAGVTTFTDLGAMLFRSDVVARWQEVANEDSFPARASVAYGPLLGGPQDPSEVAALVRELAPQSTNKLRFGQVKLVLDGSIQGFTACVGWPGYFSGTDQSQWLIDPEQLDQIVETYHAAGLTVHAHCNGDLASEAFVAAVEHALRVHPRWDHRHTVQHSQMTTAAQYRRMATAGMCANIFSNHIYYWGDQHYDITLGPERAARLDGCATAAREGVHFALHSDAPVTPLGGLHLVWCAANRLTASGRVLGENERISVYDALRAVTIDAAYTLRMDHAAGTIESGKWADFAVLEADPLHVDPLEIRDIPVWGTILAGEPHAATSRS